MNRTLSLLQPLFRQVWGSSLDELTRADAQPFALTDAHGALAQAELRDAGHGASALVAELVELLWSRNQFVSLDLAARAELERSVGGALRAIAAGRALAPALEQHRRELAAFVRARYGDPPREVACAEYTPELQLALLGLEVGELAPPLLDIGCGPSAALVRSLRAQGVAAHGLDRAAPSDVATRGDWLSHAYGEGRFGTVLSHLGFTLHFLHHHLDHGDTAYDYARAYMAILRSLRPAGRFAYTPGLPFIERLLDERMYRVDRKPFADTLRVAALSEIEAKTGLDLGYASHVVRLR